jgi:uncharacterized membrane protein YkvA (DUF1232 family)
MGWRPAFRASANRKIRRYLMMRDIGFVTFIPVLPLLHIVNPIDLIPGVIPVVGRVDDLAVGAGEGAVSLGAGRCSQI